MAGSAQFGVNGTCVGHFMESIKLYCFIPCRGKMLMDIVVLKKKIINHIDSQNTYTVFFLSYFTLENRCIDFLK